MSRTLNIAPLIFLGLIGCASGGQGDRDTETSSSQGLEDASVSMDGGDDGGDERFPCVWTKEQRPESLEVLGCPADLEALAAQPVATGLPASRSALFLVERNNDNRIHFFDSQRWRHFTYAEEKLDGYEDFTVFNSEMYYIPERRLFLGALTHYVESDIFALEISPIDKASPEMLQEMFDLIREHLLWPADLRYHPTSNALEMDMRLPPGVPVVDTPELFEGATFQGLQLGRAIGRVHRVRASKLNRETVSRMDILVLDSVPNDLPAAAGLVTSEFQTPLAHVNLLSRNRGTPNMALIGAYDHPDFASNEGKWVELVVSQDGYTVSPSDEDQAEAFFEALRPKETQHPDLDPSITELTDIENIDIAWTPIVGGKAAHFGEMANIDPAIPLPEAFAVPVSFYMDFIAAGGFDDDILAMINDPSFGEDGAVRKSALADLRLRMAAAEVDATLIADIEAKIETEFAGLRMRFRSSANVEDLEEFNGAGLYDSFSAETGDPDDTVASAVKKVWASLWNDGAFEEREWARIDHTASAMGILVHESFPDELEAANGVTITANPFDPPPSGQAAYYINVQHGAVSVTNPEPGLLPESFLYYKPPAGHGEMTYLSTSTLEDGAPVLSFDEIVELVGYLDDLHRHFEPIYADRASFGMDVEFKLIEPNRHIVIKQARPYPF